MSLFIQKNAIESNLSSSSRKSRQRSRSSEREQSTRRSCRIEQLEKREYLSADPVSIGVVYSEQYSEDLGDKFYVAWVGGEDGGCTTLDSLVVNLDKNGNGSLDEGEAYFDVGQGVYSHVENTLRVTDKSSDINYDYNISDNGMVLTITFDNFHAGDTFVFEIDLDEYQSDSSKTSGNAQVEGGEMGGSLVNGIAGSKTSATFSSVHYQTETWSGMFVDEYDEESTRSAALSEGYDRALLPYDVDDGNEGIAQAGVYGDVVLTPKPIVISGYVYEDLDVDCNKDDGEPGLAGYTITLTNESGKTWTTTTNDEGFYIFDSSDLMPESYLITSSTSTSYIDFCAKGGEFGEKIDPLNIKVDGMQGGDSAPNNNFAKIVPSTIEGNIFEDLNDANGKEEGENWDGVQYPAKVELYRITTDENGNETRVLMETQTVDAEGHYKFELDCSYNAEGTLRKLPCREYEIRMVFDEEANGYSDGKDYIGKEFVGYEDTITDIWIGYSEHLQDYDFGKLKLGSISGNVYEDRNSNGVLDDYEGAREPGIENVTVGLFRLNGSEYELVATITTDKDGYYEFKDLDIEQTYAVKEIHPEDYVHGSDTVGSLGGNVSTGEKESFTSEIVVGWDQHGVDYNFGELKLGSISGNVYEDRNDNGILDEGDVDLSGVTVSLYRWNGADYEAIAQTTTDENGDYTFDNLDINQKYAVREDEPEGYSHGQNTTVGTLGGERVNTSELLEIKEVSVKWDEHGLDYNFGELKLGSIEGTVYEDRNDNGVYDSEDVDLSGVVVELLCWNGDSYEKIGETTTQEDGSYRFDNLDINQKYAVRETEPEGYEHGKNSTVGTLGGERVNTEELHEINNVVVEWGDAGYDYNFGELKPGSISGTVYEDRNDNGVYDDPDVELSGVVVDLYRWNGSSYDKIDSTTTDEKGYYCFEGLDVATQYAVRETEPEGYATGKNTTVGSLSGTRVSGEGVQEIKDVPIGWNDVGYDYNFGELKPGSIEGIVFEDYNDNGVHEEGEAGIPGVTVVLYKQIDGEYVEAASTVSDAEGKYKFEGLDLDVNYGVREDRTAIVDVYDDGKDHVGSLGGELDSDVDYISQINVQWDDKGTAYDYGELKLGSVSGYVYNDVNDNGVREESLGEKGIANTTVELYQLIDGEYTKIDETKTDENGYYIFDKLDIDQTYGIKEIQPEGWIDGKDAVGTLGGELVDEDDWMYAIPVGWADEGVEYDFGELGVGSLSGYVYEDNNDNGIREEALGEQGIKNVEVQLYVKNDAGEDVYLSSQTTDENGYYEFTDLTAGKVYMIHEIQPTEYNDGKDAVGTIFDVTVGELGESDYIVNILLPNNGEGVEYDFGELVPVVPASLSGYVFYDTNRNNVKDSGEAGIGSVLVSLNVLDEETGAYVSTEKTAWTDSEGYYVFADLEPERYYQVVETQPVGYTHVGEAVGTVNGEKVGVIAKTYVLSEIYLGSDDDGVHYDFGEIKPGSYVPTTPDPIVPTNTWSASPTTFSYVNNQPYIPGSYTTLYGGGGFTENYSFKLSVLDDGSPRSPEVLYATNGFRGNFLDDDSLMLTVSSTRLSSVGEWFLCDGDGNVVKNYKFGADGAKAVVGHWNGDRTAHIGIFVDGRWYLDRDGDGDWDNDDLWADLGAGTDQPVTGDWNGDGKDDIGVFGPQWATDPLAIEIEPGLPSDLNRYVTVSRAKNLPPDEDVFKQALDNIREAADKDTGKVRRDLVDHVFEYGSEGDIAVTGDWNGDGVTKIGVYRNGEWYLDMNGDGRWNENDVKISNLGGKGYIPVVGDWNGDGIDTIGLFHNGEWALDVDGDQRLDRTLSFGQEGDQPVSGDWNGDGVDEIGVYRPGSSADAAPEEVPTNAQNSNSASENSYAMN